MAEGEVQFLEDVPPICELDDTLKIASTTLAEGENGTRRPFQDFSRTLSESLALSGSSSPSEIIREAGRKNPDKLLHHLLPITCLKLLEGIVLVASEGPSMLLKMAYLEKDEWKRFQLFPSQCMITGMEFVMYPKLECGDSPAVWRKQSDKMYEHIYVGVIWAGSLGTVVRLGRSVERGLDLLEESIGGGLCDGGNNLIDFDFIPVAGKWLEGGNVLALLSVLNFVILYERRERKDCPGSFTDLEEIMRVRCSKSETLFSGTIEGNSKEDIRVFGGTVFNGICVWDVSGGQGIIKHELKCHDGIIFSMEYYSDRRLLMSTSDDRTVAAWEFTGSKENEEVKLIRRFYGHDARVWRALSVQGYVLSVGESSDVRVNILKDGQEHKVWRAHEGAPIFTCVYDQDFEVLYTGGNDGSIRKWPKWWYRLKPRILPFDVIPFDPDKEDKNRIQGSGRWSENKDYPKNVVLLDINHALVPMESGRIMALTWEGKQYDLLFDEHCEGYQIIKVSPDHKILAVAGNNGHFYTAQISSSENLSTKTNVFHAKKLFMTKISWNILSLIWLDDERLLIICFNRAISLLLQETEKGERSEVQFIQTFDLNLQRPGVPAAVEIYGKHIILGDELGALHVFRYHKTSEAIKRYQKVHKDGISSLLYYNSTLYSTGRDGIVKTFSLKINMENDLEVELIPLTSVSMSFDWITGIYVNMGQMLICGFQKEDFIVCSYNEKRPLGKIQCGGGSNRKWDFKYGHGLEGSRNASFAFVRDKEIFYTFLPMEAYLNVVMKEGLHSRTINCAVHLRSDEKLNSSLEYLTGSEDGSLKLFQWNVAHGNILSTHNMENHVSSIRTVWKITDISNRTLIFSGGGRSHLCIYELDFDKGTMQLVKEIVLVKTTCKQTEGDVRVMDIAVVELFPIENKDLWCFSACSDGYVRVLYYNAQTQKFKIAGLLTGNGHAVMKIQLFKTDFLKDEVIICGVTSNGYLVVWKWHHNDSTYQKGSNKNSLPEKSPEFIKCIRRTAFLSMKMIETNVINEGNGNSRSYAVVCGGDDCSISFLILTLSKNDHDKIDCQVFEKWAQDQIQRASVVGVDIDDECIYTLSNDQIIGFWSWSGELKKKLHAGVSDCQGFVVDKINSCIMCFGKGISWVPLQLLHQSSQHQVLP